MRKRRKPLKGLLFLLCIGLMDYPFIMRALHKQEEKAAFDSYEERLLEMDQEERRRMCDKACAYNMDLYEKNVTGFFDNFTDLDVTEDVYNSLLNVDGSGLMAVVEIPKIQVKLPVYHGTSPKVLQIGAGHLEGSSLPVGGRTTHTCIAAHRGLPSRELFTRLDLLETGDLFYIHTPGEVLAYQVRSLETVSPDQTDSLKIQKGEDLATLITCTPYGINTHRLYVHGKRVEGGQQEIRLGDYMKTYWWMIATAGLILAYMQGDRKKDRRQFRRKREEC